MRNPLARAGLLAVVALLLVSASLRYSSVDIRTRVMNYAATLKHTVVFLQRPIAEGHTASTESSGTTTGWGAAHGNSTSSPDAMNCDDDLDYLLDLKEKYRLQSKFEYYKRYVKVSRQDIPRRSLTKTDQSLMPEDFRIIDTDQVNGVAVTKYKRRRLRHECAQPLTLPVTNSPFPSTANLSDFMFGVSTTYQRFTDSKTSSINEWSYWLTDGRGHSNGGKLVLFLMGAGDAELEDARTRVHEAGVAADVYSTDASEEMARRYLSLVPALYRHEDRPGRKWLVVCDDDTFFPSPNALARRFAEFNASEPLYIGTLSEDINNVDRHGSQAFGGAGVFISVPLAAEIAANFDACATPDKIDESDSGWGAQGDILLRKCIYEHSDVRLTALWELWQLDMLGDPSGFYEAGLRPLSLHHYRGGVWHVAHPYDYTKVAHLCGEDCTLQRFQTADGFVVATSFSVIHYPLGVAGLDMAQVERTFAAAPEDKGWNMDFMFGPQRKPLHRTGRKMSWDLQESARRADGSVSQVYVRRADDWRWVNGDGRRMSENDGIIELVWIV